MSVDGGYDIKILLEGREQLFLEYVAWLGRIYPFSAESPYPRGTESRVRRFDSDWPDERFKEPSKKRRPPDFLS